jgi:hypothetical protein
MSKFDSGSFVYYKPYDGAVEQLGLVLRSSVNKRDDDTEEKFVEVVGPLNVDLVDESAVRGVEEEAPSEPEVTESSADVPTGIKKGSARK